MALQNAQFLRLSGNISEELWTSGESLLRADDRERKRLKRVQSGTYDGVTYDRDCPGSSSQAPCASSAEAHRGSWLSFASLPSCAMF